MPVLDYFWTANPTLSGYLWIAKLSIETIHYSLYIITPTLIHKWEEDHQSLSYAGGANLWPRFPKGPQFPACSFNWSYIVFNFSESSKVLDVCKHIEVQQVSLDTWTSKLPTKVYFASKLETSKLGNRTSKELKGQWHLSSFLLYI